MQIALKGMEITAEDRAALMRLARRGRDDRISLRARAVMMLAEGATQAATARKLSVGVAAVRAWRKRWLEGGVMALRTGSGRPRSYPDGIPTLPIALPATEAALLREAAAREGRGRRAAERIAIESWVRDAAALGQLAPGARLPSNAWFSKRFDVAPNTVSAAMCELGRQGFVETRRRAGVFLSSSLPFEGRYMMILSRKPDGSPKHGIDAALTAAAHEQEKRLGIQWDFHGLGDITEAQQRSLWAEVAAQRRAGVFIRSLKGEPDSWPITHFSRVPIYTSQSKWPIQHAFLAANSEDMEERGKEVMFRSLRSAGVRRVAVLDFLNYWQAESHDARLKALRATAAGNGIRISDSGYLAMLPFGQPETERAYTRLFTQAIMADPPDAVAVMQDNFAPGLCEALAEAMGAEKARRIAVFAIGNRPALPKTCLPVTWHGFDYSATLDSFVAWCDAIHAGAKSPPPPVLAVF